MRKAEEEKEIQELRQKSDKMLSYAKIVKEMHWPELSEKKRAEMKRLKDELARRNKKMTSPKRMIKSQREIDLKNDEHAIQIKTRKHRKLLWKSPNSMRPPTPTRRVGTQLDYL